jgi:uncharacterized membrane protein YeaQ/YmgE (transglycosylase-associated protein family)
MPSLTQFIVWIIVGLIAGSLTGFLITWQREGFGLLRNLGVGLVGALVGGLYSACSFSYPISTKLQFHCAMLLLPLLARYSCSQHFGSGKDSGQETGNLDCLDRLRCPLVAQSGHCCRRDRCLLSGVKRTSQECAAMSVFKVDIVHLTVFVG